MRATGSFLLRNQPGGECPPTRRTGFVLPFLISKDAQPGDELEQLIVLEAEFPSARVLVPEMVVDAVGIAAIAALSWWVVLRVNAWRHGDFAPAHTLYMASHHTIFFIGYLLIGDVTHGWLVINIWHNAQYILFVWLQNNARFRDGIDPAARSLSTLCQSDKILRYFATCLAVSTLLYAAIKFSSVAIGDVGVPLIIVIYQTINFHHYIVDGFIWRSRKSKTPPAALPDGQRG